jgi:hypothetical protein
VSPAVRPVIQVVLAAAAAAAATALAASACRRTPPEVASCRDPLAGVWLARTDGVVPGAPLRGDEQLGFDLREEGGSLAIYPLWDTSRPPGGKSGAVALSPWRIVLTRAGEAAVGTISWRTTQAGHTCLVKQPARLSGCHNRDAVLDLTLAGNIDPSTCAVAAAPTRLQLTLERQ